jgi:hypothetical protein
MYVQLTAARALLPRPSFACSPPRLRRRLPLNGTNAHGGPEPHVPKGICKWHQGEFAALPAWYMSLRGDFRTCSR